MIWRESWDLAFAVCGDEDFGHVGEDAALGDPADV